MLESALIALWMICATAYLLTLKRQTNIKVPTDIARPYAVYLSKEEMEALITYHTSLQEDADFLEYGSTGDGDRARYLRKLM